MSAPEVLVEGWPAPKGFANGRIGEGKVVHVAGQIGMDAHGAWASAPATASASAPATASASAPATASASASAPASASASAPASASASAPASVSASAAASASAPATASASASAPASASDADFLPQFAQALDNVIAVVRAAGGVAEDIAEMTVFVTRMQTYRDTRRELAGIWRGRLGKHFPAMALIGVSELFEPKALVEIQAIAYIGVT